MKTEKRMIDANALSESIKEGSGTSLQKFFAACCVATAPTVDAVEVVRCGKCRFCKEHPTSDKVKICTNKQWNTEYHPLVHDDDFCSYGERKGDDNA